MNRVVKIFTLLLVLFCASTLYAGTAKPLKPISDVKAFKAKIEELSTAVKTIKSDFIQEKHLAFLSEKIVSKGGFSFKKENLLRWEYKEPYEYLIIINGSEIIIKDEDQINKFDIDSNKMFKEINQMMLGSIQGNILNDTDKYEYDFFESSEFYFVRMTPIDDKGKEFVKEINIYFNKETYSVKRFNLVEVGDDYMTIDFINERLNDEISDSEFTTD